MFRDRIFQWSRDLSRIAQAWNQLGVAVTTAGGLMKSALSIGNVEIDTHRVEISREVSRAYIQPVQGNR